MRYFVLLWRRILKSPIFFGFYVLEALFMVYTFYQMSAMSEAQKFFASRDQAMILLMEYSFLPLIWLWYFAYLSMRMGEEPVAAYWITKGKKRSVVRFEQNLFIGSHILLRIFFSEVLMTSAGWLKTGRRPEIGERFWPYLFLLLIVRMMIALIFQILFTWTGNFWINGLLLTFLVWLSRYDMIGALFQTPYNPLALASLYAQNAGAAAGGVFGLMAVAGLGLLDYFLYRRKDLTVWHASYY